MSSDRQWGIWIDRPGWHFWAGLATSRFIPILFSEEEAKEKAKDRGGQARLVPAEEIDIEWNEEMFKRVTKDK